jgi:protein TonB
MVDGASPNTRLLTDNFCSSPTPTGRIGGALSLSLFSHIAGFLIVAWVTSHLPADTVSPMPKTDASPHIIWIDQRGLALGGGASGDRMPQPPRRAQLPGKDALTVPVGRRPSIEPTPAPDPPRLQQIILPAVATAAGLQEMVGIVSSMPSAPTDSLGPGSGGAAGTGKGPGSGGGDGPGLNDGRNGGTGGEVYQAGNGTVAPQLVREIKPMYTPEAMHARVQGLVALQAIVLPDGSVGPAKIMRSLDTTFGLDQEALRTVRRWRFLPGTRGGKPVAVLVEIEMMFTLR